MMNTQHLTQVELIQLLIDKRARDFIHTSFPAKITRINDNNTVDVLPLVATMLGDNSIKPYQEIFDVRMQTYACQLGDVFISLPIRVNDLVWVMVSERDTSSLMETDGSITVAPNTKQTHDLSDCFAIPAFFPDKLTKQFDKDALVIANHETKIVVRKGGIKVEGSLATTENLSAGNGATGSFTTPTGQIVTVENGIVTNIF